MRKKGVLWISLDVKLPLDVACISLVSMFNYLIPKVCCSLEIYGVWGGINHVRLLHGRLG